MTLKSRAALIICGVIIFLVAAPLTIFFARGYYFDWQHRRIVKTGTVVVRTDPKGAAVFFDGQEYDKLTPFTRRFVLPGEYQLLITKSGWQPWKKQITVYEQLVTAVPTTGADRAVLFLDHPASAVVATTTTDFLAAASGNAIFRLQPGKIVASALDGTPPKTIIATSSLPVAGTILDHAAQTLTGDRFLISAASGIWYVDQKTTFPLPSDILAPRLRPNADTILAINKSQQLVEIAGPASIKILASNVRAFIETDNLYYIAANPPGGSAALFLLAPTGEKNQILGNLPAFQAGQIIATPDRQLFLILDNSLFQVTNTLHKLNDNVSYASWNSDLKGLLYGNAHEVWLYSDEQQESMLITRNSQMLGPAIYNAADNYFFMAVGKEIKAMEYDPAGVPNVYTFAQTKNPLPKFAISAGGDDLSYFDGPVLMSLKLR